MTADVTPHDPFTMSAAAVAERLTKLDSWKWDEQALNQLDEVLSAIDIAIGERDPDRMRQVAYSLAALATTLPRYTGQADRSKPPPDPRLPQQRVNELVDRLSNPPTPRGR